MLKMFKFYFRKFVETESKIQVFCSPLLDVTLSLNNLLSWYILSKPRPLFNTGAEA